LVKATVIWGIVLLSMLITRHMQLIPPDAWLSGLATGCLCGWILGLDRDKKQKEAT